jgi:trigger factor
MQVTVESINPVTKKVSIEIPAERVDAEIEKSYAGIQKRAKLQGFRPGKAPINLIRRTYSDSMRDEVMRRFYEQTLFKALDEHKIEPVDSPTIESDILEQGAPFKYSAVVEIMPQILLHEYSGFEVTKERFVLNPANIEGEIRRMQENMAQLIPLDEGVAAENGHTVAIDYIFSVDGFPEESDSAENAELEIGSNRMIPGFEEQLVGMKCGQQKDIRITLPESYRNKDAAGKEAVFQVTVKEIKRKELPELDDEFARQFGDYETMDQLRAKMAEYLEKQETERIENELKERVIQALIRKNPLDVPQSMVKRQLDHMLENLKNRLKNQHMSIEMMGLDEDGFRQRFRDSAEDKVKGGLLLMALVEKENITANDDDLEARYEQIAGGNPDMLGRIKEYYASNKSARNGLISEIKEDKAIRLLLDSAVITEVDAAAPQAE